MNDASSLYILGAGGHAKAVADVIQRQKLYGNIYFLDDRFSDQNGFECRRMVGMCLDFRQFLSDANAFFVAIGDNTTRRRFFDLMQIDGARLPAVLCS